MLGLIMKNIFAVVVLALILGGLGAYYYLEHNKMVATPVSVKAPPPLPPPPSPVILPKPAEQEIVETPLASPPVPELAGSDNFMLDAIAELVGNKSLMNVFHTDRIIRNIVATIDNLPGRYAPMNVMPVDQPKGSFIATGNGDDLVISPKNASRYKSYIKIVDAIDAKKLVELYVRIYPLCQQAYEELGYPKKYFNDRLIVVLNDLLAAPDIREPVRLVQPKVYYQFASPDLEGRSIGQRILMRIGSKNEAIIKTKLREIEQELKLHMHAKKVASAV